MQAVKGLRSTFGEVDVRTATALHNAAGPFCLLWIFMICFYFDCSAFMSQASTGFKLESAAAAKTQAMKLCICSVVHAMHSYFHAVCSLYLESQAF